jgi:hypothetical protein
MSLNYPPGEYYSYTNTGYNLQAVLVERVSGMSFAEFSKKRIFEPLGMEKTQWRDDFTRIVADRAIAYRSGRDGGWSMLMPFENVHGNGGLLTTVGDLLRFTHNLDTGELGGARFIEEMHRQGILNSGRTISYASGLFIGEYKGIREVQHSGATAAYRGFLTRFPDQGIAVAVMCNASSGNSAGLAHSVADLFLGDAITEPGPPSPPTAVAMSPERLAGLAGGYRITGGARQGTLFTVAAEEDRLQAAGTELFPVGEGRFRSARGTVLQFDDTPMDEGPGGGYPEPGVRQYPHGAGSTLRSHRSPPARVHGRVPERRGGSGLHVRRGGGRADCEGPMGRGRAARSPIPRCLPGRRDDLDLPPGRLGGDHGAHPEPEQGVGSEVQKEVAG